MDATPGLGEGLTPVKAVGAEMSLVREGAEWCVAGESEGDARTVAESFVEAAASGDFKKAYGLTPFEFRRSTNEGDRTPPT